MCIFLFQHFLRPLPSHANGIMMTAIRIILSALIGMLWFASCSTIFSGVKKPGILSDHEILKEAHLLNLPSENLYRNGSRKLYFCHILKSKKGQASLAKNHMQPLQALYFNKQGKMISWHINCLAEASMGRVNWNKSNVMEIFPPRSALAPDTILSLATLLNMISPLALTTKDDKALYDYTLVVYWNSFMGRASKSLIRSVKDNLKLSGQSRVKVLWVNNQNDFAGGLSTITPDDRQFVEDIFKSP